MCGIFGLSLGIESGITARQLLPAVNDLFRLSESRGKEAAGLAVYGEDSIEVFKSPVPASTLIRTPEYRQLFNRILNNGYFSPRGKLENPITFIGHARLVTNGAQLVPDNNQPVIASDVVGIHNGIIVNDAEIWQKHPELHRQYEVDTEVALSLLRKFYGEKGSLVEAARATFQLIKGNASVALLFNDLAVLLLATNNGSIYACQSSLKGGFVFASERFILKTFIRQADLGGMFDEDNIQHIDSGTGMLVDLEKITVKPFKLNPEVIQPSTPVVTGKAHPIVDITPHHELTVEEKAWGSRPVVIPAARLKKYEVDEQPIRALRRCTRCLLPETMPFIDFDENGVCNYCRNYHMMDIKGEDALMDAVEHYRRKRGEPDCLVTFSGGRDSSFCVHYVKSVLKMNPITYTYDWGMVTDLARRNVARITGQLGLEHILVSADIIHKRANIRRNVLAWLKKPDLGTVPLFMAGDKQYFYYANKLREQTGVPIVILGENLLETTSFKSGFCGISPHFGSSHTYTLSLADKFKLSAYYAKAYLQNPAYLNRSLMDTLGAFGSYYVIPHRYLNLYEYVRWDEQRIISTLRKEYDWELATDTTQTWRIGDGTASFYNYIYYSIAGFTENDTFRSNQIREGALTREQAIENIYEENRPRFESIQWYCNTIGIDMETALERISSAPKLYAR